MLARRAARPLRPHQRSEPRETELLDLLVAGADTKAVAEVLHLSHHTVQDHLKSIFAKTGARTRRVLVGRVAGH